VPGPAALTQRATAALRAAAALAPAAAALYAHAGDGAPAERLFRADALGLAVLVALAAFLDGPLRRRAALVGAGVLALGAVHAALAASHGAPAGGALALVALGAGVGAAAAALAALGRPLACPRVAAGVVAAAVLWTAGAGVLWVDDVASRLEPERRGDLRQAVLRLDYVTAAAYGPADYDRLRSPALYEGTTIASLAMTPPRALDTAAIWGGFGAVTALAAAGARRARGRA
jgi:hypothetical protein